MKKLLIIVISIGLAMGASAQRFHGGGYVHSGPRIIVGGGFYSPYYSPFYGPFYSPFYPYGYYGYGYRPSKLDMQIQDIKNDYNDRIWSVKHDQTLTHKERRKQVHQLKQERDRDINDAKLNYYKAR